MLHNVSVTEITGDTHFFARFFVRKLWENSGIFEREWFEWIDNKPRTIIYHSRTVSANERKRYIYNALFHCLRPFSHMAWNNRQAWAANMEEHMEQILDQQFGALVCFLLFAWTSSWTSSRYAVIWDAIMLMWRHCNELTEHDGGDVGNGYADGHDTCPGHTGADVEFCKHRVDWLIDWLIERTWLTDWLIERSRKWWPSVYDSQCLSIWFLMPDSNGPNQIYRHKFRVWAIIWTYSMKNIFDMEPVNILMADYINRSDLFFLMYHCACRRKAHGHARQCF